MDDVPWGGREIEETADAGFQHSVQGHGRRRVGPENADDIFGSDIDSVRVEPIEAHPAAFRIHADNPVEFLKLAVVELHGRMASGIDPVFRENLPHAGIHHDALGRIGINSGGINHEPAENLPFPRKMNKNLRRHRRKSHIVLANKKNTNCCHN